MEDPYRLVENAQTVAIIRAIVRVGYTHPAPRELGEVPTKKGEKKQTG